MRQAKEGDTVRVHYTGRLDDGTVFDTSSDRDPAEFTIGAGQVIPGFEGAVVGMTPGQSKTVKVLADDAYGSHDEGMVLIVERDQFPEGLIPEIGQQLRIRPEDGEVIEVQVIDVSEVEVTLDANHPLAGEDLTFDIELIQIV